MITVPDVQRLKAERRRFAMLTAYDYTTARLLDEAGIPLLLIGDTLGMVVQGHPNTLPVTLDEMIYHCRAVARGTTNALLIGDMPFLSYQVSTEQAVMSAGRMIKEGNVHAVKLEGAASIKAIAQLTDMGVPVMGHLGLTPQSVHRFGGHRVQGRSDEAAERIVADAHALEQAGVFSLVLEAVPAELARKVTESVRVPTIGIGAGPHCDGQVLVIHDLLGMTTGHVPRFVKPYANLGAEIGRAAREFAREVESGVFPDPQHTYQQTERRESRTS